MNLVIDIGNTLTKTAFFSGPKIISRKNFKGNFGLPALKTLVAKNKKINSVILSSVVNHSGIIDEFLSQNFNYILLNEHTPVPIKNSYRTLNTLGKDRLANATGAGFLYPGQNVLVIDAGTCIKFDFVNSRNSYLGGAISPGFEMRFNALHDYTAHLPKINKSHNNKLMLVGKTTRESIISGVINGTVAEIKGIISQYQQMFEKTVVIITGGDSEFLKSLISKKNRIFAHPDLTLLGLNVILNCNR